MVRFLTKRFIGDYERNAGEEEARSKGALAPELLASFPGPPSQAGSSRVTQPVSGSLLAHPTLPASPSLPLRPLPSLPSGLIPLQAHSSLYQVPESIPLGMFPRWGTPVGSTLCSEEPLPSKHSCQSHKKKNNNNVGQLLPHPHPSLLAAFQR